jgi:hypothetical protein
MNNGINFVDIDGRTYLPTDYQCDRIPNKGDVLCFELIIGNTTTRHHCVVLYVCDHRTGWGSTTIGDMEIKRSSVFVVTRKIDPELGDKTWKSIWKSINDELI